MKIKEIGVTIILNREIFLSAAILLLINLLPLKAQSLFDDAVQQAETLQSSGNYELNGYVRGGMFIGPVPGNSSCESKDLYGEAAIKLRLRKGMWGDAYSEFRFRNTDNSESAASSFTLHESFVNVYPGAFDLRIGQQVVQWGKADGYNPTNVITPLDLLVFSPDEDDRRSSNFLFRSYYNWSAIRFEAIWIPVYKSSVLPFAKVDLPEGIQLSKPDYPDEKIKHSSLALKMYAEEASIDGSLSYFNGFMTMPGFSASTRNNTLHIYPTAYRVQMFGADFSTTARALGLRGEFAYKKPEQQENAWQTIPNRQAEYIIGVDRGFGNFSLIIQYIGKHVFDYEYLAQTDQTSPDNIKYKIALWNRILSGQLKEWNNAISFRQAFNCFHETLDLELLGQINFSTEEVLLKPKISYDIADDLTLTAGAQIYDGPDDTLFGMLDESNSAGFIELKASF